MLKKILIVLSIFILIAVSLAGYGVYRLFNQLGDRVDTAKSDSHYYTPDGKGIIYSSMGNWFELGKSSMDADVESFEVLNRYFAKDKKHAYYMHQEIDYPVDIGSFRVIGDFTPADRNNVYYLDQNDVLEYQKTKVKFSILEGADANTYEFLDYNFDKDKNAVYFRKKRIDGADPESFILINAHFSKDSSRIYYWYNKDYVTKISDSYTYAEALNSKVLKTDENVFLINKYGELNKIEIPENSVVKSLSEKANLIRVNDQIFQDGSKIDGIDAESAELIKGQYIKDKKNIYVNGELIKDVDLSSFQILYFGYAKDKNNVYYDHEIVDNADPESFTVDEDTFKAFDKYHQYKQGKVIE